MNLNKNLDEKKELIEKLKNLINLDIKMNEKYLQFKEIQRKWFNIGPVSRRESSIIWNTFQHHIKNFYDYLHLNRKFKEIDSKHNHQQKEIILKKAKELIKENDIIRTYKFYQRLNKRWKYEIGPTDKENDKILNNQFLEIGKKIYNNKREFDNNKDLILEENLLKKEEYIKEIDNITNRESKTPKQWQKKIKDFEEIKNILEKSGPVPSNKSKLFWEKYKKSIKNYYSSKNSYYKSLKKIYRENILKQKNLIEKVQSLKSNKNSENNKKEIIYLQKEWKKINPVPYKVNQKNFKEFKSICNYFFNKVDDLKANELKESKKNKSVQNNFLSEIENDLSSKEINLEKLIIQWGKLGEKDLQTEKKFEKTIIKVLISKGFNKNESKIKFLEFKCNSMNNDEKKLKVSELIKELDNLKKELSTLENNLSFFNEKSKENVLLNKVHKDIKKNKEQINNISFQIEILKS